MSRLVTLVVTGVSTLALSAVAAPVWTAQSGVFDFRSVTSSGVSKTGNWCC